MQWFRDRNTVTKLMMGFGLMAALICFLGYEGVRNVVALNAATRDMYDITATMPSETTRQEFQLMLQNLLVERFQIRFHHETRTYPGYELVVAPGGTKLKESVNPGDAGPSHGPTGEIGNECAGEATRFEARKIEGVSAGYSRSPSEN